MRARMGQPPLTYVTKRRPQTALQCLAVMEIKRLITHFTYRIEPKPEGGFIAHATDPSVPPLEAPTREELQQKIQANIATALAAEFPGLKLPLENKEVNFAFHIEHKPGGGFILQSTDGKELPITGSTHAEIETHFAEKVLGALGKALVPELSQALAGRLGSGDVKVVVNRNVIFSTDSPTLSSGDASSMQVENPTLSNALNPANSPITPEPGTISPIVRFLLAVLIVVGLIYFFLHR
jgi:hypothetical protein